MFLDTLERHLAVCAQSDLPRMAKMDANFWNVVSIREPSRPKIPKLGFKQIHTVIVYDADTNHAEHFAGTLGIPRREHVQGIYRFADATAGEPLLIHCWAGVSRSTAIALSLIARSLHFDGYGFDEIKNEAVNMLLAIRRQAAPNPLILEFGLAEFLSPDMARELVMEWVNHPILFGNRHKGAEPGG